MTASTKNAVPAKPAKKAVAKKRSKKPKPGTLEALVLAGEIAKKYNLDFSYIEKW